MPNIPQINIGNTTYDVKDNEARNQIDDLNAAIIDNEDKIKGSIVSTNLMDTNALLTNRYCTANRGIVIDNRYTVTGLIRVDPMTVIMTIKNGSPYKSRGRMIYNADGTVYQSEDETVRQYYYNNTNNPLYVRFNIRSSDIDSTFMIIQIPYISSAFFSSDEHLNTYTQYLIPLYTAYNPELICEKNVLSNGKDISQMLDGLYYPKNLYNPNEALMDTWMYSDGHITQTDEGYNVTNYIPVNPYKCIVITSGAPYPIVQKVRNGIIFDKNKSKTGMTNDMTSMYYNNTNELIYIRFNFSSSIQNLMICETDYNSGKPVYPDIYIPYEKIIPKKTNDNILPPSKELFANEVDTTVASILSYSRKRCFIFTLVTDTHYNPADEGKNRRTIDTFANVHAVNQRVFTDSIIHLGDIGVDNSGVNQDQSDEQINTVRSYMLYSKDKAFMVNGNHEGVNGGPPTTYNYNCMGTQTTEYAVRELNNPYFYSDVPHDKIRMIFLCTVTPVSENTRVWGIIDAELAWLRNVLIGTPNDYNIMIFSHIGTFDTSDFRTNRDAVCSLLNAFHNHTGDFASKTGKCICWFCGHEHFDWIVPSSKSGLDFPMLCVTASGLHADTPDPSLGWEGVVTPSRTDKTVSQDAWNVIIYDMEQNKIECIRFGAGSDMEIDCNNWDVSA